MTPGALDLDRLRRALELAEGAIGTTEPNPRVGCVLGRQDGTVLAEGATQHAGGPHAEAVALQRARQQGHDLHGATAWVTLEPCAHHGRTPPCCDALVAAGVARVVIAVRDPFPLVAGQGIARLRAAGVTVDVIEPHSEVATAAWDLNIGFFSRVLRQRPWVRVKMAASLDGRTALDNGVSQWITGEAARADGHRWRQRASAILTGIGTVLADDPRLDVRLVPSGWQPLRVVADSKLRIPPSARVLAPPGRALVVAATMPPRGNDLRDAGVDVQFLPGDDGRVDLARLLNQLAAQGINELHVEAGARLSGQLLRGGWADELLLYLAPRLLGSGRGVVEWPPLQSLAETTDLQWLDLQLVGGDARVRLLTTGGEVLRSARSLEHPSAAFTSPPRESGISL